MKTRIIASYLKKEGYNEIGDRDVDLDEYTECEVNSIQDGMDTIVKNDLNGIGQIHEQKFTQYGWKDVCVSYVSEGLIYRIEAC